MKTNMNESKITARITFGHFQDNNWIPATEPIVYNAETKSHNISAKCDCHLVLDDGTVITAPAWGRTALLLGRMMVTDNVTGKSRHLTNGDIVSVSIPGSTYKSSGTYEDKFLGCELLADYHNAPFFNFCVENGIQAVSARGFKMTTK